MLYKSTKTTKTFNGAFLFICRLLCSRQGCKLYNEGGKCNMWTSGYLFDLSKTKKKYTFVVQEKYPIKTIFCYYGKINTMYKCGLQDNSVQKNLKKKTLILAFEEKL